jgi:hypothetical protein
VEPDSPTSTSSLAASPQAVVPRLMKFSGALHDAAGKAIAGAVDVTFSLYSVEAGGNALWFETQSVQADELGRYTALLGAMHADGLPVDLFTSGEVRWLGIQVGAEAEQQPRVLLVSVPYALKAGDAETLGGKPASAYMLSDSPAGSTSSSAISSTAGGGATSTAGRNQRTRSTANFPQTIACSSLTSTLGGTVNSVPRFTGTCQMENSNITQSGSNVGIGTSSPAYALDITSPSNASVRLSGTGTHQLTIAGATSGRLGEDGAGFFFSSDTNGGAVRFLTNNGALHEWMRVTSAGNVGVGTTTPAHPLDVAGEINAASSGANTTITSTYNGTTFDAIDGLATAGTGATAGVFGASSSTAGTGVYGYAGAASGTTYGLVGQAISSNGVGVYGQGGQWAGYFAGDVNSTGAVASASLGVSGAAHLGTLTLNGLSPQTLAMDRNSGSVNGNSLALTAGSPEAGSTDLTGGDLVLSPGLGTGLGGGGNLRLQTSGANDVSGTSDNLLVDRIISVARAKQLTLNSPGYTSLISIHLTGTHTAGGRIFYVIRATDGGSQIATEEGVIQYLATPNSITCTVQTTDKLHLGTVNSGCTPGFFNPGSQPGVSIYDNVSFSSAAPIVVHEVYFTVENDSGAAIRLEP